MGIALPRERCSVEEIGEELGLSPEQLASSLGLRQKAVARHEDEHPSDLGALAAQRALSALGATADDVGLVIYAGVSRDYLGSFSVAVDIAGRIGARSATAYDLGLGCAATLLAMDVAARAGGHAGAPPLALVVTAERWSGSFSRDVPFPPAMAGHADGGAACVIGPDAPLRFTAPRVSTSSELNDFVVVPAGGTKHPTTEETVRQRMQYRRVRGDVGGILEHYVQGYCEVLQRAAADLEVALRDLDLLVCNQVRRAIRSTTLERLELDPKIMIETYPDLGHLGGADLMLGIAEAQREGRLAGARGALLASTLAAFAASGFVADGEMPVDAG